MSASSLANAPRCPECGAEVGPADERCWLCHGDLAVMAELVGSPTPAPRVASPLQFSLETLLLVVTLSAVCLGALVAAPGLGVLLLLIAVPALVRTCVSGIAQKRRGAKLSAMDKVMAFLASAAIAWAALAAAGVAFSSACTVSVLGAFAIGSVTENNQIDDTILNVLLWSGVVFCTLASLAAFAGIFWITWPKRT